MKTIILHGILAKKFGKTFKLSVNSTKEACHALACQIPAFYEFMMNAEKQGVKFAIFNGKKNALKKPILARSKWAISPQQATFISCQEWQAQAVRCWGRCRQCWANWRRGRFGFFWGGRVKPAYANAQT